MYQATKEQLEALAAFDRTPYDPAPAPVASTEPAAAAPATGRQHGRRRHLPTRGCRDSGGPGATERPAATELQPADPAASGRLSRAAAARTEQPARLPTTTAAIDKSTLTEMPAGELKAEDLIGTTVYGANDENIGEISDIVLSQDGKVDAIIIDVGGFLGMGEKPVAIGFDKLAFMTDKDGNKYLYTHVHQGTARRAAGL